MTNEKLLEIIRPLAGEVGQDVDDRTVGYLHRCRETFTQLIYELPVEVKTIVDVGCGMGGIGLLLADTYSQATQPKPMLFLLDGDSSVATGKPRPEHYESYSADNTPWNDAGKVASRFREFGYNAHALTPKDSDWGLADIIISTRSWGHHYPVETYLEVALRSLTIMGRLFIEIRNQTDGLAVLDKRLKRLWIRPAAGSTKCVLAAYCHGGQSCASPSSSAGIPATQNPP